MMVVKAYISRLYNYTKNNKISNDGYSPVVVYFVSGNCNQIPVSK